MQYFIVHFLSSRAAINRMQNQTTLEVITFLNPLHGDYIAFLLTTIAQSQIMLLRQRQEREHLRCRQ